jgi:4-nitrophenyl phosphatase
MLKRIIRAIILDMDGVLWRGTQPIGDLHKIFYNIQNLGLRFILATNNSTLSPEQYQSKLLGFGVSIGKEFILTSSQVAAEYISEQYRYGGPVFIIGENGLVQALGEKGFYHSREGALAVVVGMDRNLTYEKLSQACLLIRSGVKFIGTNADRSFPIPEGLAPGAGSILAALEAATDVSPIVVGKPSQPIYQAALNKLESNPIETLIVGDRLETDILGGQNIGCLTACVLSGVTKREEALNWKPAPDMIFENLEDLIASFDN